MVTTIDFPQALPVTQTGKTSWRLDVDGVSQKVTNLTKPYWGPEGYTKGDLLAYYFNAAPWILPFLADRALTLKRMPDGADGDFFYAKNAPGHVPDWMPRAPVVSDGDGTSGTGKVIEYLMAQDTASLVYVANLGCIEMHPWHSRVDMLGHPDYAFFDLDPMEVGFDVVKQVAGLIRVVLEQLGLTGYPRTSGATGIHVYVPIDRVHTFAEVRELITRLCRLVNRADPERTTMEWQISDRTGKVFLDAGMNTEGRNIAAAYSVRPHRGAPVSMPLRWEELTTDVEPQDFTIANVWPRLEEVGDEFTAVLAGGQTLWSAMEAVGLSVDADRRGPFHSLRKDAAVAAGNGTIGAEPAHARPGPRSRQQPPGPADPPATPASPATPVGPDDHPDPGELSTYTSMRDFAVTNEPAGEAPRPGDDSRFVIQHHLATRLHHDLRLERGGTLRSWALPKGLPLVPELPHLAMQTEDHPLEYLTFHGDIPEGEYGGGPMRIWDTGTYETVEWEDGKVTFRLTGHRHRGEWHLFRVGRGEKGKREWLVTRAKSDLIELPDPPPVIAPCLATGGGTPFDDDDWLFEVKWDGVRAIATVQRPGAGTKDNNDGITRLVSRNGNDISPAYPELSNLWERVLAFNAVLDGEVVALGPDGRPSFGLLQQRMHLRGRDRVDRARRATPVHFMVFDLLALDGQSLVAMPLEDRLALLDEVLVPSRTIVRSDVIPGRGTALYAAAEAQGLEGVVAKRRTSRYLPGRRSPDWLKVKVRRTAEVVVAGWIPSSTGAGDLGSLVVAAHDDDGLRYLGRVGTGFDAAERARLKDLLDQRPRPDSPLADDGGDAETRWTDPIHVAEVEYGEVTGEGRLRAPSYRRLVDDADPASVTRAAVR